MLSKEAFDQAYQNGVAAALNEWGLTKTALVGELGSKAGGWLSANPAIQRALIGAGVGGAVGGATDIGAGRGALAGGLAGAGSAWGQRLGQKAYGRSFTQGRQAITGSTASPLEKLKADLMHQESFGINPETGNKLWHQNQRRWGNLGNVGLGALAGGGSLMASQPPPPKPWYAGLMGG